MIQYRNAPAYQEYAASMLADYNFRALSLQARGVLYTLRLECWVNKRLPSDIETLSKVLGIESEELLRCIQQIGPFFSTQEGWLICKELDDYRAYLEARKKAQSNGGKLGAAKTNKRRRDEKEEMRATRRVTRDSLVQNNSDQNIKAQSNSVINEEISNAEWIEDYERLEEF